MVSESNNYKLAHWSSSEFIYILHGNELSSKLGYGFGEYLGEPTFTSTIVKHEGGGNLVVGWKSDLSEITSKYWEEC